MLKKFSVFLLLPLLLCAASQVRGEEVKVVPIGGTIQPEGGGQPAGGGGKGVVKKPKPKPVVVAAGKSFMIQFATALSSGLTKEGETVYIRSVEDVGPANRPVILMGAVGQGVVSKVDSNKKNAKLVVELKQIEAASGDDVQLDGTVDVDGKGEQAFIAVGDRYTATLEEKVVAKRRPRKEKDEGPGFRQTAYIEVMGKGVKADIKKGQAKGKVQLILEPPKGTSLDDLDNSSIALYRVNDFTLPTEVPALAGKAKPSDKNKNGTKDLVYDFDAWSFIKNQARGTNNIYIKGKMQDGTPFNASTRVTIDY